MNNEQITKLIDNLDREAADGDDPWATATTNQIRDALLERGVHPCVARDWSREANRRGAILDRVIEREGKKAKGHHVPFRRIIKTITRHGREFQYHATKGWRSYQIPV
jgi:hypothetical protein